MPRTPYIVAMHGTSRDEKLWPEDRWRELLERMTAAGFTVVVPWGSDRERERSLRIGTAIDSAVIPPQRLPISALASLLARAELVVGVDTGFTHLAAALGTPTLGLFTASDPARCGVGVVGGHARDLGGNGRVASVEDVLSACGARLRATPRC
jgi:heptosyltransferase-1